MNLTTSLVAGCAILLASSAYAQDTAARTLAEQIAVDSSQAAEAPSPSEASDVHAEATVELEVVDTVNSRTSRRGDVFTLRLVDQITVNDQVIAPVGTSAVGEVVDAWPSASGGQPGMLILSGRYLELNEQQVPIRWPTLMLSGQSRVDTSNNTALHLSPFFVLIEGTDIEVRAGTRIQARLVDDVSGQLGEIVFFRPRRNTAGAYRYGVREGNVNIRLRNGSYFVYELPAGIHEFQISGTFFGGAPSQTLRIDVQPGERLYVEHAIDFLGVSNSAAFDALSLRPLEPEDALERH